MARHRRQRGAGPHLVAVRHRSFYHRGGGRPHSAGRRSRSFAPPRHESVVGDGVGGYGLWWREAVCEVVVSHRTYRTTMSRSPFPNFAESRNVPASGHIDHPPSPPRPLSLSPFLPFSLVSSSSGLGFPLSLSGPPRIFVAGTNL